jgi:ornithine carbamoyltransferase
MIRTYGQSIVEELAKFSSVPIINGLTDEHHPCQVLADIQTIREKFHKLEGLKLAYVGDAANVANSLIEGCTKLGINISLACPKGYQPTEEFIAIGNKNCLESGAKLVVTESIEEAVTGADILYTDIWVSMGKEDEAQKRIEDLQDYQINDKVVKMANKNCIVMHCLPAHRGEEITDDVIEGPHSVVFDEAENRLHAQKAIMALTMK